MLNLSRMTQAARSPVSGFLEEGIHPMPLEVRYADGRKGAICLGQGRLKGTDFTDANRAIFARDFSAEPLLYIFFDADDATAIDMTNEDVREIANQDLEASKKARGVVVAISAEESLTFGLSRMWEALIARSGWSTQVFRDRAEAVRWIKDQVKARSGVTVSVEARA